MKNIFFPFPVLAFSRKPEAKTRHIGTTKDCINNDTFSRDYVRWLGLLINVSYGIYRLREGKSLFDCIAPTQFHKDLYRYHFFNHTYTRL